MLEKCITLNDILYKNKHYRIDKIIFVDEKDVKKLEGEGAIRRLEKPKPKSETKRIVYPITPMIEEIKEIKFKPKKKRKYTKYTKVKKKKAKERRKYAYPKT